MNLMELFLNLPKLPKRFNRTYVDQIKDRTNKRIRTLATRFESTTTGHTMPDLDQVAIGSGKCFELAVLFLDICGFTERRATNHAEQKNVLMLMDIFMAEMMNIVMDHDGVFEKNTGDGLMAYFGTETSSDIESVHSAVEAAVFMHYFNDRWLTPWFISKGVKPISFKVGIDFGEVTIGNIGVPKRAKSFVAIGSAANIACRLLESVPDGGIAVGNEVYLRLPENWNRNCQQLPSTTGYVYIATSFPYPVWRLDYRLVTDPMV